MINVKKPFAICAKYAKFKSFKISYICSKIIVLSTSCAKCAKKGDFTLSRISTLS